MTPNSPARPRRFATERTIFAMMVREMVTTYGRSPGGYLWAVLEPVAAIALLSVAFSLAFRAPSLGTSFPLFYATGYLPYALFHDIQSKVAVSIRFSKPLLTFGAVTWLDAIIARFLLNLLTHLMIILIVASGILFLFDTRASIDMTHVLNALAMAAALAIGFGTLNCYLFAAFPAWERIWVVLTRPLFILSGVLFLFEDVPTNYQWILWLNPVFHVTGEMRAGFYAIYHPTYVTPVFVYGLAFSLALLGMAFLRRFHDDLIHK